MKRGVLRLAIFLSLIAPAIMLSSGCASKQVSKDEARSVTSMTGPYQQLTKQLHKEIKAGHAQVSQLDKSLKIDIVNDILFPRGGWSIDRKGKEILDKVIQAFKTLKDSDIEVYGYTDNSPVMVSGN